MKTEIKTRKTIPLIGGAEAHINLLTGEPIIDVVSTTDDLMGATVSHKLIKSDESFGCGTNSRLNFHEKFKKNEDSSIDAYYIYTDSNGDSFSFKEAFYYLNTAGNRVYIEDKENVCVGEDGTFSYSENKVSHKVYREVYSSELGLRASTKVEDVIDVVPFEQRTEEIRAIEEEMKSYASSIPAYVTIHSDGKIEETMPKSPTAIEVLEIRASVANLASQGGLILRKDERVSYMLLLTQKEILEKEIQIYNPLNSSIVENQDSANTINKNYENALFDIKHEQKNNLEFYTGLDETSKQLFDAEYTKLDSYKDIYAETTDLNADQLDVIAERKKDLQAQLSNVELQINELNERSNSYCLELTTNFAKLLQYEERLANAKLRAPVSYVFNNDGTRCFNENGDLIAICKSGNRYLAIEYETYYDGEKKSRIHRIYDDKERSFTLAYDGKNALSEIINPNGEVIKLEDGGDLYLSVTLPNENSLSFLYESDGIAMQDSYKNNCQIALENDKITRITKSTRVDSVSHNNLVQGEGRVIYDVTISYDTVSSNANLARTILTDEETGERSIYVFDKETEMLIEYYEEENGRVVSAEKYELVDLNNRRYFTYKADPDCLFDSPYSETFEFTYNQTEEKYFDPYCKQLSENHSINYDDVSIVTESEFEYNSNDRVNKSITTKTITTDSKVETIKSIALFEYNNKGALVKKQSYIEGEEGTNGITIEENVYDKNGNILRSIKYNSLDPSSKYYTQKEYNEIGQMVFEYDATGKYKVRTEYNDGSSIVNSKTYPNGSTVSYGYSSIDGSTAITTSTKDGEESSIQSLRTNGLLTKVKSDNVEYYYDYDHKGRTTYIGLNALTLMQGTYTENEDTEVSTQTYANGETITTTQDKLGKVLNVSRVANNKTSTITNTYNNKNQVTKVEEVKDGKALISDYYYNEKGNTTGAVAKIKNADGDIISTTIESYTYDELNNLTDRGVTYPEGTLTHKYIYSTDSKRKLAQVKDLDNNINVFLKTDCLDRSTGKRIALSYSTKEESTISYLKQSDHATNIPVSIKYTDNSKLSYKYDRMGNISAIYENGALVCEYAYDKLNRLVRENNKKLNKTWVYVYDVRGNILSKAEYPFTRKSKEELDELECILIEYKYGALDVLSTCGDYTFSYGLTSGVPSIYKGVSTSFQGRAMVAYGEHTYTYSASGLRMSKDNITFNYDTQGNLLKQSNGIEFLYDQSEKIGFKYDNNIFFYRKDIQGNVIAIVDTSKNIVVKYTYDAWGNHTIADYTENGLGDINPIRYRSYYYDTDVSRNCVPEKIKEITADIRGANSK